MRYWKHAGIALLLLGLPLTAPMACRQAPALEAPGIASAPAGSIPQRTKEENAALGRQHKTAGELYQALKTEAKGGQPLTAATVPDWSGVYSRPADKGFTFDPDTPAGVATTAKLTPEYQAKLEKRIADRSAASSGIPLPRAGIRAGSPSRSCAKLALTLRGQMADQRWSTISAALRGK
jgi:hypothetical protein